MNANNTIPLRRRHPANLSSTTTGFADPTLAQVRDHERRVSRATLTPEPADRRIHDACEAYCTGSKATDKAVNRITDDNAVKVFAILTDPKNDADDNARARAFEQAKDELVQWVERVEEIDGERWEFFDQ